MNVTKESIFDVKSSTTPYFIVHGCNALGVMGAGFAAQVKGFYPEAYYAYRNNLKLRKDNKLPLLGSISFCGDRATLLEDGFIIVNGITQSGVAAQRGDCVVDYDAVKRVFENVNALRFQFQEFGKIDVRFPMIGAGLAGGNWDIISKIIEETLSPNINAGDFFLHVL